MEVQSFNSQIFVKLLITFFNIISISSHHPGLINIQLLDKEILFL